jgi:peptide/nickel transport system substrate-binding protein
MKQQRRRFRACAGLALAIVMVAAAGCGGGGRSSDSSSTNGSGDASKPVLRIGITGTGLSFDPGRDGTGPQTTMRALAYEALIHMEPDGTYAPGLATSWRYVGSGNRVFELTLRDGVKFSDGTPLTAKALKTWFGYFNKHSPLANTPGIERLEVVDRLTARLRLSSANASLPYMLSDQFSAGAVVSPKALARPKKLGSTTAGAGPYVLDAGDTVVGDHYTYVPNELYYNPSAIKYRQVTVKVISNPQSMLQATTSGQLDVAEGDASTAPAAQKAGLSIASAPGQFTGLWVYDRVGKLAPPMKDVRVRQALNYALDRKAITTGLMGELADPSSQLLTVDAVDETSNDYYPYDPEKARELLAAAGYPNGFSLPILSETFAGTLGDPVTQAIAKYFEAVGVKVRIISTSSSSEYTTKQLSGDYPVAELFVEALPMKVIYSAAFAKDGVVNFGGAVDPRLDALYAKANVSEDPSTDLQAVSRYMTEQALFVPVFQGRIIYFVSDRVDGVKMSVAANRPKPTDWSPRQ